MNERENYNHTGVMSDNTGYQLGTALEIRLNTDHLVKKIEMFLRGYEEKFDINEDGEPVIKFEKTGEMKASEKGIQSIMGRVQTILTPQVVQGNFNDEEYGAYLCRTREGFATDLIINLNRYKINIGDYNAIIDMIMRCVEPFISRLKHNKERESFDKTIRSSEVSTSQVRGNNLPFMSK